MHARALLLMPRGIVFSRHSAEEFSSPMPFVRKKNPKRVAAGNASAKKRLEKRLEVMLTDAMSGTQ